MFISFLSDYGHEDEFVGVCHGVIARRCPDARVIDVSHSIPRHDVLAGALTLASAVRFLPAGVVLAVVDPGVGGERRAMALRSEHEGRLFVGPDNGLLMAAVDRLGGVAEAVDIGDSPERLRPTSSTFHGRDVFAPVAAALAAGEPLTGVGEPLRDEPPGAQPLVHLELPSARRVPEGLLTHVVHRDTFGNLVLDARPEQVSRLVGRPGGGAVGIVSGSGRHEALVADTFAGAPEGGLLLYEDSWGMLALAVNRGSASELLAAGPGAELLVKAP
ncbi:MAG TPA: SAM-dependent chlorinase/fluorinase [Solirubrobacteraceae bacterium]|nr:SAM-dependent chlorinase/fluorinase [Solirubrobacteraceae bacterium]